MKTFNRIWSQRCGSITLADAARQFAREYWAEPRKVTCLDAAEHGMSATFQIVGGAGGVYVVSFGQDKVWREPRAVETREVVVSKVVAE